MRARKYAVRKEHCAGIVARSIPDPANAGARVKALNGKAQLIACLVAGRCVRAGAIASAGGEAAQSAGEDHAGLTPYAWVIFGVDPVGTGLRVLRIDVSLGVVDIRAVPALKAVHIDRRFVVGTDRHSGPYVMAGLKAQ